MKVKKIASIMFIVTGMLITWGCNPGSSEEKKSSVNKQAQKPAQPAQSPVLQETSSGEVDKFGRKPGDQHYGHDHAPASQQQTGSPLNTQPATPSGGPDKFGRNPGDQHYGHDHE